MSLLKTNEIQNYNGSSLTLTASTVSTSAQLNTGGNISVTGSLNVSDDSTTRTNLGLGTIATQDSDSITVTGGTATLGALTVSGSDSGDLVRITQTGSGNALVVEDSANPDSTPFVVDSSGNVGVGAGSPQDGLDVAKNARIGQGQISADSTVGVLGIYGGLTTSSTNSQLRFFGKSVSNTGLTYEIARISGSSFGPYSLSGGIQFSTASNDGANNLTLTERMRIDSSGNLLFNSGYGSVATAYGCRAWVNFDGTTNTAGFCTIRDSGNVSSISDNGTGNYQINLTTAMPDANYSAIGTSRGISGVNSTFISFNDSSFPSTTGVGIYVRSPTDNSPRDTEVACVAIFR